MSIDVFPATVLNSTLWNGQTYEEGTFTVTGTGFSGTAPSGTARYVRVGKQLTVMLPALSGTSNATTFTVTGVPSALWPVEDTRFLVRVTNNGVLDVTMALFYASTGILLLAADITGLAFTASGTKALANMPVSYLVG